MKKVFIILLAMIMSFSFLTACGGGDSKEVEEKDPYEAAPVFADLTETMIQKVASNKAAALDLVDGVYYSFYASVLRVEEDHAVVDFRNSHIGEIVEPSVLSGALYLDKTALLDLEKGLILEVTGPISDIKETNSDNGFGGNVNGNALILDHPTIATRFDYIGELLGPDSNYDLEDVWDLNCGGDQFLMQFDSSVNLEECYNLIGSEVTITASLYTDGALRKAIVSKVMN